MLKITKVVSQSAANMVGCSKWNDYNCGRNARNG